MEKEVGLQCKVGRVRKKKKKNEEKRNLVGFGDKDTFILS